MWPRIARTLITYREAALWYLLIGAAVTIMVASGADQGHPLPVVPKALPAEREVHPPPPLPPPPTTAPPTTRPPATQPPPSTTQPPPTSTRPASRPPAAGPTGPETRPEQVGENDQPVALPPETPPPPIEVPPATTPPSGTATPTTAPPTPTTTRAPRNKATGLPDADDLLVCVYEQGKNLIQRPCR